MLYKLKQILRKIIPYKFILFTHKMRAILAVIVYGFPGKKIRAIGVAGTKGKTTTVNMIAKILEEGGYKVAMLSTANFQIGGKKWLNDVKLTTTSPFYFQKFLAKAVKEKCDYVIVEISSHGLVQYRHWGVPYKTVVLTNMMSDHLDYHKTYANYKNSHNALLTKNLENLIINYDDEDLKSFLNFEKVDKYAFSLKGYKEVNNVKLIKATDITLKEKETEFNIKTDKGQVAVKLSLIGEFNIYNSLAATAVGLAENIKPVKIKKALEFIRNIPGRLEKIDEGQDFEVIVDYAHSPDSLKKVYEAVKPHLKNKMIAVLGGTGDRDKTYRSKAGAIADEFADIVIVTNEDPYSENPEKIMDQVMSGIKNKDLDKNLFRILDRKEAIEKAVKIAEKDDLVMITGKGAEQFIICGEKKVPWDDREVARKAIKQRNLS
ncbi:MAG: UDP-N-acetylmuramoyl-L-alanyl-D-glutamate--2,6-diaminopimelate ligase [Candidatus Pacebacteria bacterium]|nr:UDP-N-acetylmuramoyl-L-alanyl-D-glutamate--2,6-diaminopimelate ligase [Candidatus Paceibacterota bacterium]